MRLEPEQVELLRALAEEARSAPRDKRFFMVFRTMQADVVQGPGGAREVLFDDVRVLIESGLLRVTEKGRNGDLEFAVAPQGFDVLAAAAEVEPLARVEEEIVRHFVDGAEFRSQYPAAYTLWAEAADLLWDDNADAQLTTIGHKTREAVQEFAAALVERHDVEDDSDVTKTVRRLKRVISTHRERLGDARTNLLDALVVYWGEVNDLLQRQEHGARKEGEPLTWEDGRRAVFQTAVVMYEIHRTIR